MVMSVVGIRVSEGRSIAQQPTLFSFAHGGAVMNYQYHYDCLIERAYSRSKPAEYCEEHHITPSSLGGSNAKENLVWLTGREHYVAHMFLAKLYGYKMWAAVRWMGEQRKRTTSRMYCAAKVNSLEVLSEAGKIGGAIAVTKKLGIHGRTTVKRFYDCSEAGKKAYALKRGVHGRTKEQMITDGRKAGLVRGNSADNHINVQVWECLICGMKTKAGPMGRHFKATGHIGKVKR